MAKSIVIAEKPSQARDYKAAVGDKYGTVLAARGHLFTLLDPEKEDPRWKEWSIGVMRPESGFFKTVIKEGDADIKKRYAAIRDAAKGASRIYIATDPDREGEGIGRNIVNQLRKDIKWDGELMRVLPLGTDKKSLQESFQNARPGEEFAPLYQSWLARAQGDHIFNLSLTRSASKAFLPEGRRGSLSIGRVLTPTFGMVCRRHEEIVNFVPETYYTPWVDVTGEAGTVRLLHPLKEDERLFDKSKAIETANKCAGYDGPLSVKTERKRQGPPPLYSLSKLQVEASRRMKWGVQKTLEVLQRLYQDHKVATYPRSSEVSLPEAEIENIPAMRAGAFALPFIGEMSWSNEEPVVRKKKGAFSDKDLKGAAHYAIVPNPNTASEWASIYPNMDKDEQALFEIIVRRYLAVISPDRVYDSTKMSITAGGAVFSTTGSIEIEPGWKEAYGAQGASDDGSEDDEEDAGSLPAFKDGDRVQEAGMGAADKLTKAPPAYTEATLATAMIEAWKLVENPEMRAKLKETDGIGTEATRASIIDNLKGRGFVAVEKGKIVPTKEGGDFYRVIQKHTPRLLDVALTGEMELALENIKSGEAKAVATVDAIAAMAEEAVAAFVRARDAGVVVTPPPAKGRKGARGKAGGARKRRGPPTEKMIAFAKTKAERDGKPLPEGVLTDFDKCRAFLDQGGPKKGGSGGAVSGSKPTEKQLAFAKKLSRNHKVPIPDDAKEDRAKLSAWIDLQLKK